MLTEEERHVIHASFGSGTTPAFGEVFVGDGCYKSAERDSGKHVLSDGEKGASQIIVCSLTFQSCACTAY